MRYNEFIAETEFQDEPDETDGFVADNTRGGYDASLGGEFLGNFSDRDDAVDAIKDAAGENYFPTIWFVDDHGGMEIINDSVNEEKDDEQDFQVGDKVHLGFGTKGGAGFYGVIKSITIDEVVIITNGSGRSVEKMYVGPRRFLTRLPDDELMASHQRPKAQQRLKNHKLR